ncbi:hypothetical protein C723_0402 [Christiangramia flava JLT2011]|uniref:Uncharacterized protein n=1 Tax=Christiangramia flava JLT2011 TaxID=1229726 RepID=A0A1L7I3N5_9FLAO|nr:hypothetical protein GRFL_1496 [Christiangramia flava JLT2011]OSS40993.1 hypothetical protein C723_0402 [Christiangramia flava JLT2011]
MEYSPRSEIVKPTALFCEYNSSISINIAIDTPIRAMMSILNMDFIC